MRPRLVSSRLVSSRLVSSRLVWLRATIVALLVGGAVVAASRVALADAAQDAEVRSFQALTDWSVIEGSGVLALHPEATVGDSSLLVGGGYWRRIESRQMESLGSGDPNVIQLDVRLAADGLAHWESLGMVIKAPSQGVHWLDLGQVPLDTATSGGWTTVSFSVPSGFHAALSPSGRDLSVLISVNTASTSVALDNLRLAGGGPADTSPVPPSRTLQLATGLGRPYEPVFKPCQTHDVQVEHLESEFADIWARLETPEAGKRTSRAPNVALTFSEVVDPSMMQVWFVPTTSGCGRPIQASAPAAAALWLGAANPELAPAVLNALILGDLSGTPDVQGPVAVGGHLTMSSFSINGSSTHPLGAVVGGQLDLTNGTIHGDLRVSEPWDQPTGVTILGGQLVEGTTLSFSQTFRQMADLTANLLQEGANGSWQSNYGNLALTGEDPEYNVFEVQASALATANYISLNVPNSSGVVINVRGASLDLGNLSVQLNGLSPSQVLWNFPELRNLHLHGISFQGTILAPRADVVFNNGNLAGTLVATSLHGTGELHYAPLNTPVVLGSSSGTTLTFAPTRQLQAGCEYYFEVYDSQAANAAGQCLADPLIVRFSTRPLGAGVEDDFLQTRGSVDAPGLTELTMRPGVFMPVEDALFYYADALGVPVDGELALDGSARPHPTKDSGEVLRARQYQNDVLVAGPGFFIETGANGGVVRMRGRAIDVSSIDVEPQIESATAHALAAPFLRAAGGSRASLAPPEGAELAIVPTTGSFQPDSFRLSWRVPVLASNGVPMGHIDIDALDGSLIEHTRAEMDATHRAELAGHLSGYSFAGMGELGYTDPNGASLLAPAAGLLPSGSQASTLVLASTDPTLTPHDQSLIAAYFISGMDELYVNELTSDRDGNLFLDTGVGVDLWERRTASLASLYATVEPVRAYLDRQAFDYGGSPWVGLMGMGHGPVAVEYQIDQPVPDGVEGLIFHVKANGGKAWAGDVPTLEMVQATDGSHFPVFPDVGYHESGHLVFSSLQARAGRELPYPFRESASIAEGIADIFSSAVSIDLGDPHDEWSLGRTWPAAAQQQRDMSNPGATNNPSFYQSSGGFDAFDVAYVDYKDVETCDVNNNNCGAHQNSTIVSHWAYLLTVGSASAGKCGVNVDPILGQGSDPQASRHAIMQLLFDAYPDVGETEGFEALRDQTYQRAGDDDPEMALRVAAAWYAVGLGMPSLPSPNDGALNVEPWRTTLEFVAPFPGEFTVQIARNADFTDGVVSRNLTVDSGQPGQELGELEETLEPDTLYYWRAAPGSPTNNAAWVDCSMGTWSFTTANKVPVIETAAQDGSLYITDFLGDVGIEIVPGAETYEVSYATDDAPGCANADAIVEETDWGMGNLKHLFLGDGFNQRNIILPAYSYFGDLIIISDPEHWSGRFSLELFNRPVRVLPDVQPGSTFWLSIAPVGPDGSRGECQSFNVKMSDLGPFYQEAPEHLGDETIYDKPGTEIVFDHITGSPTDDSRFLFTKSSNAAAYQLTIEEAIAGGDSTEWWYTRHAIYDEVRSANGCGLDEESDSVSWDPEACGEGNFLARFGNGLAPSGIDVPGPIPAGLTAYLWTVRALDEAGQRRLAGFEADYYLSNTGYGAGGLRPDVGFRWNGVPLLPAGDAPPQFFFSAAGEGGSLKVDENGHPHPACVRNVTEQEIQNMTNNDDIDWNFWCWRRESWDYDTFAVKYCVPRQIPFVDEVTVHAFKINFYWDDSSGRSVPFVEEDFGPTAFDTSRPNGGNHCVELAGNLENSQFGFAIKTRSFATGWTSEWEGVVLNAAADPEEDDDEPPTPPAPPEDICETNPPPPPARPTLTGYEASDCTTTGSTGGTRTAPNGEVLVISEVVCGEVTESKSTFLLQYSLDDLAKEVYIGICADQGICTDILSYRNVQERVGLTLTSPQQVDPDLSSPTDIYSVSAWAVNECGEVSPPHYFQFHYNNEDYCNSCSLCDLCDPFLSSCDQCREGE